MDMRKMRLSFLASAALVGTLAAAGPASAQDATWRPFVSVTPFFESEADLDRGGDFSFRGVLLRAGTSGGFGTGNRGGVVFSYDYYDSSFSSPVSFGGVAPWNNVQHYGVGAPLAFALGEGWMLGLAPSVDWFKENGARTGDSLVWGATVSAIRASSDGNRLGLGVAHSLTSKIRKCFLGHRRLASQRPLAAGQSAGKRSTRPAGLEPRHRFDNDWPVSAERSRHPFSIGERSSVEWRRRNIGSTGLPACNTQSGVADIEPLPWRGRQRATSRRRSEREPAPRRRLRPCPARRAERVRVVLIICAS
jgi:hypothetical protein